MFRTFYSNQKKEQILPFCSNNYVIHKYVLKICIQINQKQKKMLKKKILIRKNNKINKLKIVNMPNYQIINKRTQNLNYYIYKYNILTY